MIESNINDNCTRRIENQNGQTKLFKYESKTKEKQISDKSVATLCAHV